MYVFMCMYVNVCVRTCVPSPIVPLSLTLTISQYLLFWELFLDGWTDERMDGWMRGPNPNLNPKPTARAKFP